MPHEDFFEAKLIEFTYWIEGKEKILKKYDKFEDLPNHLIVEIKENKSIISLKGKKWDIIEINKDLRAHGKGMHVKVRLQKHS
ncbi:MAG: hypothetical protein ACE5GR_07400 [Nitrosopumilus sp.]